jgi:hypothetical protein
MTKPELNLKLKLIKKHFDRKDSFNPTGISVCICVLRK